MIRVFTVSSITPHRLSQLSLPPLVHVSFVVQQKIVTLVKVLVNEVAIPREDLEELPQKQHSRRRRQKVVRFRPFKRIHIRQSDKVHPQPVQLHEILEAIFEQVRNFVHHFTVVSLRQ